MDIAYDKDPDRNGAAHWTDCWTMRDLGSLDRPSFSAWLRHLAGHDPAPVPAAT